MGQSCQQRGVLGVPGEDRDPKDLTFNVEESLVNLWLLPVSQAPYFLPSEPPPAPPTHFYHQSRIPKYEDANIKYAYMYAVVFAYNPCIFFCILDFF